MQARFYTPAQATSRFGLSRSSLLRFERMGLVRPVRTPGGHRRYPESELFRLFELEEEDVMYQSDTEEAEDGHKKL